MFVLQDFPLHSKEDYSLLGLRGVVGGRLGIWEGEGVGRCGNANVLYVWIERKKAKKKKMILFDCAGRPFSFPPHYTV